MEVSIHPELRQAAPHVALGVIHANLRVTERDPRLDALLDQCKEEIVRTQTLPGLQDIPEIKALRQVFRATGKEPSRYRGSQESLFRRILQGKGLDAINTVVDINNLISLESRHSAGCYDLAQIDGPVEFRIGQPGEIYPGIGRDPINVAGLPVFADRVGPFGSPTRDSARAKVTLNSAEVLLVIISFNGPQRLEEFVERTADLLREFAHAVPETTRTTIVA